MTSTRRAAESVLATLLTAVLLLVGGMHAAGQGDPWHLGYRHVGCRPAGAARAWRSADGRVDKARSADAASLPALLAPAHRAAVQSRAPRRSAPPLATSSVAQCAHAPTLASLAPRIGGTNAHSPRSATIARGYDATAPPHALS